MEWTDEAAVDLARQGDRDAFRVLVERHGRSAFRLAYRMIANEQDAEDITQESFLRAFKQLATFDGRASFRTWFYRIVSNCALDLIRKRGRMPQAAPSEESGNDPMLAVPATAPTPDRLAMSGEVRERLGAALETLSATERTAFVLRHFEGLGIEEVSRVLGCAPAAARHSVFRAVQKLRRELEPLARAAR